MNTRALLLTPFRCGKRSLRWSALVIMVVCIGGAVLFGLASTKPDWPVKSAYLLGINLVYLWAFLFPGSFLLALDARTLRLPGVGRTVVFSLLLYAFLCVVPATLALGAFGGDMVTIATLLTLCIVISLAFALLPRYIAMWFGFLPALHMGLRDHLSLPGPDSTQFVDWALPAVFLVCLVVVLRWRTLLHSERSCQQGMRSALVMKYRFSSDGKTAWNMDCSTNRRVLLTRPDWLQGRADLSRVGPRHPLRSLRVALGGLYVPRTWAGHLRTHSPTLLSMLLIVPVMLLIFPDVHDASDLWQGIFIGFIGWIGVFGSFMLFNIGTTLLRRQRSRTNTEMPLLALMPGLGSTDSTKRALLRAGLGLPLSGMTLLLLLVLTAAWLLHLRGLALAAVSMSQIGSAMAVVAMALDVLGGRPLSRWLTWTVSYVLLALMALSVILPLTFLGRHPMSHAQVLIEVMLSAWVVFALVMALVGRRGWKAYTDRPHAFLTLQSFAD
jgi:hypothetical protein